MKRKSILLFLLQAAFGVTLLGVVPGTQEVVARSFQGVGNVVFASFGDGRSVHFQWADPESRRDSADTRMVGRQRGELAYRWRVIYNAHSRWFWPAATLVAMVIATPMAQRRRALALALGLLLFSAYFLAEVATLCWALFGSVAAGAEDSWLRQSGLPLAQALFNSPIPNFSLVFLLWAWLAQPARGIDIDPVHQAIRRLVAPGRGTPPEPPPPDAGRSD